MKVGFHKVRVKNGTILWQFDWKIHRMSKDNILKTKSFDFAVRIINLYRYLIDGHREYVLARQILKAGTAIGAMVREAEFAESRQDFQHKLSVGLKEANECIYWLQLLFATGYIDRKMFDSLCNDAKVILSMLVRSIKTLKESFGRK